MMAERGKLVMTDDGPRFVMVSGNRQEIDRTGGQVSLLYFNQYTLDLGEIASTPGVRWREAGERYLGELFSPGNTADDIRNANKLRAEGHRRLVTPFYGLALADDRTCRRHFRGNSNGVVAGSALPPPVPARSHSNSWPSVWGRWSPRHRPSHRFSTLM